MPASALGHRAFPFWDASFVCQYWAFMELYQTQLCRDIYFFFFNACVLGFFFKERSDKISRWHLGASPWFYGLVPLAPRGAVALTQHPGRAAGAGSCYQLLWEGLCPARCSAACREIRLFYQPALPSCFQEIFWSVGAAVGRFIYGGYPGLHQSKGD